MFPFCYLGKYFFHISDFRLQQFETLTFKDILNVLFFSFLFSINTGNNYVNCLRFCFFSCFKSHVQICSKLKY